MIRKMHLMIWVILAFLFVACGGMSAPQEMASSDAAMPAIEMPAEEAMIEEGEAGMAFSRDASTTQDLAITQEGQQRLIIRTAEMSIVVPDTEEAMDTVAQMADENGGWVVNSSVFQYDETAKTGNMRVRIPAEGFQSFIDAIEMMAVEVTRITTSGQDVTEEFVDLSARLENLEATADRVREFLDEAENVEEALAVNQELSRLEGEIEVIKGRLEYLQNSAAFSTITIDFTPDVLSQPIEVGGWQPQGVARDALESLIQALQSLIDIAIWLVIFILPIVLIIGIPLWLLIRYLRRRRRNRHENTASQQEEESAEESQ